MNYSIIKKVPLNVWKIGASSMMMNASSIIAMTFFPLFFVSTLGFSAAFIGVFESLLEAIEFFIRIFSGAISDKIKNRRTMLIYGCVISFLSRAMCFVIPAPVFIFSMRVLDRAGNAIHAAPRDSLIAESTTSNERDISYSMRFCLSIMGSSIGGYLGYLLVTKLGYRDTLVIALVPLLISIIILLGVKKSPSNESTINLKPIINRNIFDNIPKLSKSFWLISTIAFCFSFGNIGLSFIIFISQKSLQDPSLLSIAIMYKGIICACISIPIAIISQRVGRKTILIFGFFASIGVNITFCISNSLLHVIIGITLMGIQFAVQEGIFLALIAEKSNQQTHGTAFGLFYFIRGISMILSSILFGVFWEVSNIAFFINTSVLVAGIFLLWLKLPKQTNIQSEDNDLIKKPGETNILTT